MLSLENKCIGLIFALKKEAKPFLEKGYSIISTEPFSIYKVKIDNIDIILAISGLGKVRASACTQHLLNVFPLDFIINAGTCGGICPKLNIGDVLLANLCIEYDFKSISEGTPIIPVNSFFINIALSMGIPLAVLGSADSNADNDEKKNKLHQKGIQIVDWEGTAILKTSKINKKETAILKVITDLSSSNFEQEFLNNLNRCRYKLSEVVEKYILNCYYLR
jgi:adenosylhomocysteine nucleosidase